MQIECIQTRGNKTEKLIEIIKNYEPQEICYMGDDVNDIEVMKQVGLPVAVADAEEAVKQVAVYSTSKRGGRGAVREICDFILPYKKEEGQ
jgi:YrbI family 3-deoxy-D-manno-octulosonate 8-phosphate phosphatase